MAKSYSVHIDPNAIMERYNKSARELGKAINAFVYHSAIKDYVPEDTGTLARSIREKVTITDGKMICSFSSALHYAHKQHDFELRHSGFPKGRSFADYGTSSMTGNARDVHSAKYESGLENMGSSVKKYAAKFFSKPLDFVKANLDQFASVFYRSFNKGVK